MGSLTDLCCKNDHILLNSLCNTPCGGGGGGGGGDEKDDEEKKRNKRRR